MKKLICLAFVCLLAGGAMAQSAKMAKMKQMKAELKEKASKTARKEAKQLAKEGWKVLPGSLPLEKQLDKMYLFLEDVDEDLNPVYIVGRGQSIGENIDAARIQATELARLDIAGQIGSEASSLIDNMVGNKQVGADDAASMTTLLSESKTIFSQKLGRVRTGLEIHRVLDNKRKEVQIRLVAKDSDIKEIAKQAIREEMEKRGMKMSDDLDKALSTKR